MSSEAIGYVFRHSPFRGATFAVHLALADSANDQHCHQVWMSVHKTLTKKARLTAKPIRCALRELVEHGYLHELESAYDDDGKLTGRPARYQFLFPDAAVIYETRGVGSYSPPQVGSSSRRVGSSSQRGRDSVPMQPKGTQGNLRPIARCECGAPLLADLTCADECNVVRISLEDAS